MRRTQAQMAVAVALMAAPYGRHWGYELSRAAGVRSGVMYPMLTRFLEQGLLADGWEDPATISGRPPRRYYELTDAGRAELGALAVSAPPSRAATPPREAEQGAPQQRLPRLAMLRLREPLLRRVRGSHV